MKITVDHILDIWRVEPSLTYSGFSDDVNLYAKWRAGLIEHLDEVQLCVDWLSQQEVAQRITPKSPNSYSLKHAVEFATRPNAQTDYTYVSNGCLIAAAIILAIPYQRCQGNSLNAQIAIKRSKRNVSLHGPKAYLGLGYAEYKPLRVTL